MRQEAADRAVLDIERVEPRQPDGELVRLVGGQRCSKRLAQADVRSAYGG
jgi:hypothetical protein